MLAGTMSYTINSNCTCKEWETSIYSVVLIDESGQHFQKNTKKQITSPPMRCTHSPANTVNCPLNGFLRKNISNVAGLRCRFARQYANVIVSWYRSVSIRDVEDSLLRVEFVAIFAVFRSAVQAVRLRLW